MKLLALGAEYRLVSLRVVEVLLAYEAFSLRPVLGQQYLKIGMAVPSKFGVQQYKWIPQFKVQGTQRDVTLFTHVPERCCPPSGLVCRGIGCLRREGQASTARPASLPPLLSQS